MNSDQLKLFAPIVFFLVWLNFSLSNKSKHLTWVALFFTSIVAFSQNFTFIYRELHQGIQVLIILFAMHSLLKTKKIHKFNYIFLILLIFIGLSLVFSKIDDDARLQLVNLVAAIGVTNYLYSPLSSASRVQVLMLFVGRLAIFSSIVGLIEYAANISERVEVTFTNPNYYAFFLGIGYCAVFQYMKGLRKNLSLILILVAIILSGSRVAFAFPLLQLLWHVYRLKNIKTLILYSAFGIVSAFVIIGSGVTRFSDVDKIEASDAERIVFTRIAYRMANDHPLTGVGWGRYISEFGKYSSAAEQIFTSSGVIDAASQDRRVTHNDLTRILAELGWVAFVASLVTLVVGFVKIVKNKNHEMGFVFPIWLSTVIFSQTHNNLNSALFWFVFLMPFYFFRSRKVPEV